MSRSRITDEERISIIESYINNEVGWNQILHPYGIANSTLETWIRKYRELGASGLVEEKGYVVSQLARAA